MTLYCLLRKSHVPALPEEFVRQKFLKLMIQLGYPQSYIVIEKRLSQLPHLAQERASLPDRRVDILCYAPLPNRANFSLSPLLVVECKAAALQPKALQQVAGYNYYIGSPFLAVTNGEQTFHGWLESPTRELRWTPFLPYYKDLLKQL